MYMYVVGLTLMVVSVVAVKPFNRSGKNYKTGRTKKDELPRCLIYEVTELYVVSLTLLVVSLVAIIPSNHPQPDMIIEIHEAEYKVMEGAGEISIPIHRSGYLKDEVRVVCCTQSVTAQGSSSDVIIGDDFVSRPDDNHSTIVFNFGEDMKYCVVKIIDDPLYEEDESFMVTLKEPMGGKIGDNNVTTVVILADPADEPKFSFSAAEYRVDESVGSFVVMVKRTGSDLSMPGSITVRSRQIDPVSAQDGVDYVGVDKILSFSAVVSEQTLDVTVIDDLDQPILEGPKRFLLELKMPLGGSLGETNIATVVIEDTKSDDATKFDDATKSVASVIEFEDTVYYGEEKDGQMTAVIIRHGDITHDASIRCFTRQNTAIVNVDYIERTDTDLSVVYFAPGQIKADCIVDLIDDMEFEEVESLQLVLGTPTSSTAPVPLVGGNNITTLMIYNPENEPKFSFSAAEYRVDESVGSFVVMVMRTGSDLSRPASVTVRSRQIDPISAQADVDYVTVDKVLSFTAVVSEQTLDVAVIDDLGQPILEGPERFLLELKMPVGGLLGETNITTVVIDDTVSDAPVIEFEDTVYYAEEKDGQMTAVIIRHGDIAHDASIRCFTRQNTAIVNVDYIERTDTDLSVVYFAPGQRKADCVVDLIHDEEFEEVESFHLVLGTPTSSAAPVPLVGKNSSTTLIIYNAEIEPKFSFSAAEYRVDESGGSLVVMVVRTGSYLSKPASVTVRSRQIDSVSAQAGVDYVSVDKIISFSAAVMEQTLDVTVIDDLDQPILEGPKRFLLELKLPMGGSLGETNIATVVIDDTKSDAPVIEFEDTVYYGEEKDGQMTAVIIRHRDITHDASVRCFTRPNTAIVNVDYIERTDTDLSVVYFAPGQKYADCVVDLIDDMEFEEVESLHLVLGTPTSSTAPVPLVGGNSSTILMINNTEDEPKFSFSAAEYQVDESVGSLVVTVMRTGNDLSKPASVTVRSRQIDPVSAQAGVDYVGVDKVLSFSAVINEQTLDVTIIDDLGQPILEGPERFLLELKMPIGGSLGETNIATVVIDDTKSDAPVIEFEDTVYYGEEKDSQMTAVIIRHGDITHDASVRCFTRQNTAIVNVDYIERTNNVVYFAPGQKKADCVVDLIDDKQFEEVESLHLILGTPTSSTAPVPLVGGNSSTTLMINNTEDEPKFSFGAAEYRVDESVGSLVVMVMRTGNDLSKPASVTVRSRQIDPVSAEAGVDYVSVDKVLSFSALLSLSAVVNEQTLVIAIIDDLGQPILEGPERFLLELKMPMGGSLGETNIATVVIDDTISDAPVIEFKDTVYYGEEKDGQMTAVITRHGDISHDASIRCFTRQNTAIANVHYIERTDTDLSVVYFAPGQKKANCVVDLSVDDKAYVLGEVDSLHLDLGTPTSSMAPVPLVGGNSSTTLMINNTEDEAWSRENVALLKESQQSSLFESIHFTGSNSLLPKYANDGVLDQVIIKGVRYCAHTNNTSPYWWTVDLGESYDIGSVSIYNRAELSSWRLYNYSVIVYDPVLSTWSTYSANPGELCYFHHGQSPAILNLMCDKTLRGRYVQINKLSSQDNEALALCEIEVFSATNRTLFCPEVSKVPLKQLSTHANTIKSVCAIFCSQREDCIGFKSTSDGMCDLYQTSQTVKTINNESGYYEIC